MKIGIRKEDKNPWEKRVPLTPEHVGQLIRENDIEVVVEPSPNRVFSDGDFEKAGAVISGDFSACDIVFAVKEIPSAFIAPNKTYCFFSHVIKGQKHNMPMLDTLLSQGCNLVDYEKIEDSAGRRLVFFGRYAGLAGMINTLWALGRRLKYEGYDTPFAEIRQAVRYADLEQAKAAVVRVGEQIRHHGLPAELGPVVCGFAGYGHVSKGAQEIYALLPVKHIAPEELDALMNAPKLPTTQIYSVVFKEEHMVEPVEKGAPFDLQEYYDHPEKYRSRFETWLPHLMILINAIYWAPKYPRLVTQNYLEKTFVADALRLKVVGDISCDVGGAIQCNLKSTDTGEPLYVYHPASRQIRDGYVGQGIVVLATDNLPCELPRESSEEFSRALYPFIGPMVKADYSGAFGQSGLPDEIKSAVIVWQGKLTPAFAYLEQFLNPRS